MTALTVVDSNVWIFMNLDDAPEHPAAKEKIETVSVAGLHINDIIVSEIFHKLSLFVGAEETLKRVTRILISGFVIYEPISREALQKALSLAVEYRIRINDAIIAAHALESRTPLLTDNTRDFRGVQGLKLIPLRR